MLTGIFTTPFYKSQAGHDSVAQLHDFILHDSKSTEQIHTTPQPTHHALYESNFEFLKRQEKPVAALKECLFRHLMNYVNQLNGHQKLDLSRLRFNYDSWYHITTSGGYFQPHNHPMASASLIYCVSPGDNVTDERENGAVVFFDPRHSASMFMDSTNRSMRQEFSFNGKRFHLQKDDIVIFPSYLMHSVEPYIGEKPRITIAANFWFS